MMAGTETRATGPFIVWREPLAHEWLLTAYWQPLTASQAPSIMPSYGIMLCRRFPARGSFMYVTIPASSSGGLRYICRSRIPRLSPPGFSGWSRSWEAAVAVDVDFALRSRKKRTHYIIKAGGRGPPYKLKTDNW